MEKAADTVRVRGAVYDRLKEDFELAKILVYLKAQGNGVIGPVDIDPFEEMDNALVEHVKDGNRCSPRLVDLTIRCLCQGVGDDMGDLKMLVALAQHQGIPIIIDSILASDLGGCVKPLHRLGRVKGARHDAAMAIADETGCAEGG